MERITKLEKPLNGKGWFYEIDKQLNYAKGVELKNWYNSLSLNKKIILRKSGNIELPF